ncbi:MAG: hypothetical protein M1438_19415 [Deltaproteobacteria bacterium]|nr:hypothetical protein [Deltaproteobacteria bacterium]
MVHPVQTADPEHEAHRTYKTLEPEGEVAVVQRPEGKIKIVFYTCSGETRDCHSEMVLDHRNAFDLAMEILQHAYRLGQGID